MKKIEPKNGGWQTQANLQEGETRIFSDCLFMPDNADESVWHEVSDEYKLTWEMEHPEKEEETKEDDTSYLLDRAKAEKVREIEAYDDTEAVNSFTFGGMPLWLDVEMRTRLKMRLEAEQSTGMTQTKIWFSGMAFDLDINTARGLLQAVEVYASQCYDTTNSHIVAVNALESVEAVEAYDYTAGYPEKLAF